MRRTRLLFTVLLLGIAVLVSGITYVRDDMQAPAPPCYYTDDATGNVIACSATNRLPVEGTSTSGTAPTTPTTDLSGWAMNWLGGSVPDATNNVPLAPWAVSDNLYYGFTLAQVGTSIDVLSSRDKGRTWLNRQTFNLGGLQWNQGPWVAYRLTSGSWLLGGNTGAGVTPANTGMFTWLFNGAWSQMALTGLTAGISGGVTSIYQQGTTVLAAYINTAGSNLHRCRSTNSGVSFTCAAMSGIATAGAGKIIDSPAANIWLMGEGSAGGNVYRSTNDGVSWISVLATGAGAGQVIECISSTVCLFVNGGASIWRSSDAGVTWAMVFTAPTLGPAFYAFVDYGNGVVAVLPSAQDRDIWLSRDSGVTWTPVLHLVGATQRVVSPYQTTQSGGSAVFSSAPLANTDKVMYSRSIGAGETQIVGPLGIVGAVSVVNAAGTPMLINTDGRVAVTQAGPGGTLTAFPVHNVQGPWLYNSKTTGAVNTPVTVTIPLSAFARAHVYSLGVYCSAGTSTLNVVDGVTTIWQMPAGSIGTGLTTLAWPTGLTGTTATDMVITLATCGAGNTGTLMVQADRF